MIKYNKKKIKIVDIDKVRPNSYNPKDKKTEDYKSILRGIKLKGQRLPVVVRENKGLEIIDGEQRWTACKELRYKKILVYNEGELSEKEAKELTIWYQQQVPFDEVKLAGLISDLARDFKLDELELPYDNETIIEYAKMNDFKWEDHEYRDIELVTEKEKEEEKEENKEYFVSITKSQLRKLIVLNKIKGCKLKPKHFEILKNYEQNKERK